MKIELMRKLINFSMVLAISVLMLGAYTRLTDAGLGCPDWPGCYGHLMLPTEAKTLTKAQALYPDQAIEHVKAWTEMLHRYLAGSLLLFITFMLVVVLKSSSYRHRMGLGAVISLVFLMGFQAALGMWTVTLKLLPPVVMGHLLGGMLIFSVLVILRARMMEIYPKFQHNWYFWLSLGAVISFIQIALGGWVSSNYAAISCQGFPGCNGLWVPPLNWTHAFDFLQSIGPNYQGGLMDVDARMTIHWVHRCLALMVYVYWMVLGFLILCKEANRVIHQAVWSLLFLLHVQMALGIFNVTHDMPLLTAVLHNGVAALILGMACVLNVMIRGSFESHD